MIAAYRDRTGESYSEIGRRAGLSRSVVHTLATQTISSPPKPETLEKLARGLQMSLERVTLAAQEAAGYTVYRERTPDTETEILIGNMQKLTPDERAKIAQLVEDLLRRQGKSPERAD